MESGQNKPWFSLLYLLALGVIPLVFSSTLLYYLLSNEAIFARYSYAEWLLWYALSVCTMAFALTPTTFVALVSGYFVGWASVGPLVVAYMAASALGYATSVWIGGGQLQTWLQNQPKIQRFLQGLRQQDALVVVLARLSPALPFAVTNVLFAFAVVPFRRFLWAGTVGMLPRTLLSVAIGTQAKSLKVLLSQPQQATWQQVVVIGLVIFSLGGLGWVFKKILQRA